MNNVSKLIKSKVISFTEVMIEGYKELGLDEIDAMILIHLNNQLLNQNNKLCMASLSNKLTLKEKDLSNRVLLLVQKGFLELLTDKKNNEIFSLDATYEQLGSLIEDQRGTQVSRKEEIRKIVNYLETTLQIVLKPMDVEIINAWIDENYTFDEIKKATLECLQMGKPYIKYIDRKLVNSLNDLASEPVKKMDDETFNLLNSIYVKNRR